MAIDELTEVDVGSAVKDMVGQEWYGMNRVEELGMRDGSCDMVYYDESRVFAFELKRKLNMKVIAQAVRWLDISTSVYIATSTWLKKDARRVLDALGIGYICVLSKERAILQLKPERLVADMDVWNKELQLVDRQEIPAGTKEGPRSTVFSRFVARAKKFTEEHPDATLRMIAMQVPNHYSSIESCIGAMKRYAHYGIVEKFWKDPDEVASTDTGDRSRTLGYMVQKIANGLYAVDHAGTVQFSKFSPNCTTVFRSKQEATLCIERIAKRQGYSKSELKIVKIGELE